MVCVFLGNRMDARKFVEDTGWRGDSLIDEHAELSIALEVLDCPRVVELHLDRVENVR